MRVSRCKLLEDCMKNNLKALVYTALMTAFVFVTTSIIQIPIPFTGGYIHAGDMTIFVAGILLGPIRRISGWHRLSTGRFARRISTVGGVYVGD